MTEYRFGRASRGRLETCSPQIKVIAARAIELTPVDFTIVHGWRDEETQNELVRLGVSKTPWPKSKHNFESDGEPWSLAVDFAPIIKGQIPWKDTHAFAVVAGCFFAAAKERGITIRWGGDWDMDGSTTDQSFMDWGHVEVVLDED